MYLFFLLCLICGPLAHGLKAKTVIGTVEQVELADFDLDLLGRTSTVAEISALHATKIKIFKDDDREFVKFTTIAGGRNVTVNAQVHSRVSAGTFYKRKKKVKIKPKKHIVILTKVRLGKVTARIRVALYDLGYLQHRFVIGRNILKRGFLVDVTKNQVLSED